MGCDPNVTHVGSGILWPKIHKQLHFSSNVNLTRVIVLFTYSHVRIYFGEQITFITAGLTLRSSWATQTCWTLPRDSIAPRESSTPPT